ncbi:MAG: molybdate ABC transporter substrate-binding protein [bacterium]|nr:molybdate ABC transporter substrate-binding protein [bacterium]
MQGNTIRVYAAVSLTNALEDLVGVWEKGTDIQVQISFAGSSTLARQIEQGAPADVYVSANPKWMDYVAQKGLIEQASRRDLLRNTLVLIAPKGEGFHLHPVRGSAFGTRFSGRLALADPEHVPAGMYTHQALLWLGWWEGVQKRLAPGQDVRVALGYVARGACAVGIVYASDAMVSQQVEVIARLPEEACDPIVYPIAIVKGRAKKPVLEFVSFLFSTQAQKVFESYGFIGMVE